MCFFIGAIRGTNKRQISPSNEPWILQLHLARFLLLRWMVRTPAVVFPDRSPAEMTSQNPITVMGRRGHSSPPHAPKQRSQYSLSNTPPLTTGVERLHHSHRRSGTCKNRIASAQSTSGWCANTSNLLLVPFRTSTQTHVTPQSGRIRGEKTKHNHKGDPRGRTQRGPCQRLSTREGACACRTGRHVLPR